MQFVKCQEKTTNPVYSVEVWCTSVISEIDINVTKIPSTRHCIRFYI